MSFCTWFTELFWGKNEPATIAGSEEIKPEPETFCRSNRRDIWAQRILTDMEATGADLLVISALGNEERYRGIRRGGKVVMWDILTLEEVPLASLWSSHYVPHGSYHSTNDVQDGISRYTNNKNIQRMHDVVAGFANKVTYCRSPHDSRQWRLYQIPLGIDMQYLAMVEEFNTDKRYRITTGPGGVTVYRTVPSLVKQTVGGSANAIYHYTTEDGKIRELPNWVMWVHKTAQLIDTAGNNAVLEDPIKVTKLEDGEDIGSEAYIYLVEGSANTYTRNRYRIEVESERLFSNKIVDVDALLGSIATRLCFMHLKDSGKLFIDNIRYLRLDGTTHTADAGGFLSIGAEAFRKGKKQAGVLKGSHGNTYPTGPLIVSHVDYPTEPIY